MHLIYQVFMFIVYCVIVADCQGGRGSFGVGSVAVSGGGRPCYTEKCKKGETYESIWRFWLPLLSLLLGGILICCKIGQVKSPPEQSTFINVPNSQKSKTEIDSVDPFQSGFWSSRYFQYENWHGPHQFSLTFNSETMKMTGLGVDNVGSSTIDGIYSIETRRISLTKKYQPGTGDPKENFGHQVTIQLTWNAKNRQFEGDYYVNLVTSKHNQDKFELKFSGTLSEV